MMKKTNLKNELQKYASTKRKKTNERFFKTGTGEYGEGDIFLGVCVPDVRRVAKNNLDISWTQLRENIKSEFHEVRLCVILILVERSKEASKKRDEKNQRQALNFYMKNLKYVNNWDLVDLSAHYIVGQAILDGLEQEKKLDELVESNILWERRVGIISTWIMIREDKLNTTLRLAKKLLKDKEDLMHKAVGWMLREAWKKDEEIVEEFLIKNYDKLPRTTLRYTIEKMEELKRKQFLKKTF